MFLDELICLQSRIIQLSQMSPPARCASIIPLEQSIFRAPAASPLFKRSHLTRHGPCRDVSVERSTKLRSHSLALWTPSEPHPDLQPNLSLRMTPWAFTMFSLADRLRYYRSHSRFSVAELSDFIFTLKEWHGSVCTA